MAVQVGRLEIETSDHVVLRYDLAGGGNRGFAALVDFACALLLVFGGIAVWAIAGAVLPPRVVQPLAGLAIASILLLGWSYFVILEWLWEGQTLGKRLFGLRVISGDGSPASFTAILIRNLVRVVDFLPGVYGLGLLVIVLSGRSQRLGDLAAGTFVVRAPRPRIDLLSLRTTSSVGPGATADVHAMPGELQRLVREFVARERGLDEAHRRRVAAGIAAAIRARMPEPPTDDDVELIRAVARSLRSSGDQAAGR